MWGLRVAVAIGVAVGIALGTFRIVTGTPLHYYIMAGYVVVIAQTWFAPRMIVPLDETARHLAAESARAALRPAIGDRGQARRHQPH